MIFQDSFSKVERDRMGNYTLSFLDQGTSVYLQGDDAAQFEDDMEAIERNHRGDKYSLMVAILVSSYSCVAQ